MLILTIEVDAPVELSLAVKEAVAMDVEKYGNVRVIEVREGRRHNVKSNQAYPGGPAAY